MIWRMDMTSVTLFVIKNQQQEYRMQVCELIRLMFEEIDPRNCRLRIYSMFDLSGRGFFYRKNMTSFPQSVLQENLRQQFGNEIDNAQADLARQIFKALLDAGVRGISTSTDWSGVCDLFAFCITAALHPQEVLEKTVISIGYGGTTSVPLLRLPAYVVTGAEMLRAFSRLGLPLPHLRLFSGWAEAATMGRKALSLQTAIAEEEMLGQAMISFSIMKAFLDRFYPEISERCLFDFREPIDFETEEVVSDLREAIKENHKQLAPAIRSLREVGCSRTGIEESLWYAAVHPVFFGDFFLRGLQGFTGKQSLKDAEPEFLISLGGPPEAFFNEFRHFLAEKVKTTTTLAVHPKLSLRLILGVGKKPVYYPVVGEPDFGPSSLDHLTNGNGWNSWEQKELVGPDYRFLRERVGLPEFLHFARSVRDLFALGEVKFPGNPNAAREIVAAEILRNGISSGNFLNSVLDERELNVKQSAERQALFSL